MTVITSCNLKTFGIEEKQILSLNHSCQKSPQNPENTLSKTLFLDHSWFFGKSNFPKTLYLLRWCVLCLSCVPRVSSNQLSIFPTKLKAKCYFQKHPQTCGPFCLFDSFWRCSEIFQTNFEALAVPCRNQSEKIELKIGFQNRGKSFLQSRLSLKQPALTRDLVFPRISKLDHSCAKGFPGSQVSRVFLKS